MSEAAGARFQVRLGDLVVAVVGSAYVFDVARRSRECWPGGVPNLAQVGALMVLTAGVGVGLIVMGQGIQRLRDRSVAGWAWAATWRLVAVAALVWGVVDNSRVLQVESPGQATLPSNYWNSRIALYLIPLVMALGLVGLILTLSPPSLRPRGSSLKPGWKSRLMVILALLVGLVIVALGTGIIPYLILLAVEAVQNAMRRAPLVARPHLFERMNLASLEALPGLVGCLLTGMWVNDDLRFAACDPLVTRTPRSWSGVLGRVATVVLAAGGTGFVLFSSIPRLSAAVAEGIATFVEPWMVAIIGVGFGGLAAGLAAQGAVRLVPSSGPADRVATTSPEVGVWPRWIIGVAVGLAAVELTAAAVQAVVGDVDDRWFIPVRLSDWVSTLQRPAKWLGYSDASQAIAFLLYEPGSLLNPVAAIWVVYRTIRLFLTEAPGRPAPLDLIPTDRLALGRFLGWWAALTLLMLASLPILGVLSIHLTHLGIRWMARWKRARRANPLRSRTGGPKPRRREFGWDPGVAPQIVYMH